MCDIWWWSQYQYKKCVNTADQMKWRYCCRWNSFLLSTNSHRMFFNRPEGVWSNDNKRLRPRYAWLVRDVHRFIIQLSSLTHTLPAWIMKQWFHSTSSGKSKRISLLIKCINTHIKSLQRRTVVNDDDEDRESNYRIYCSRIWISHLANGRQSSFEAGLHVHDRWVVSSNSHLMY